MLKYLQLNQQFDTTALLPEVNKLAATWWKEHYNKKHYEGSWSVIPLRSAGGDPDNIYSLHLSANSTIQYKDTPLLEQSPALQQVIGFFQCEKTAVRLMKLNAGAVIKEHTDHDMNFEQGEARFHIPVVTNDNVEFYLSDERVPMKEGECWYLNLSLRHRVVNGGDNDRIHLVIDCIVNDWVKEQFEKNAAIRKEEENIAEGPVMSAEEKKNMIASLRQLNTPVSNELADKIEAELL